LAGLAFLAFNTLFGAGRVIDRLIDPGARSSFALGQAIPLTVLVAVLAMLSSERRAQHDPGDRPVVTAANTPESPALGS
jgi:hypothetical protein